MMGFEGSKRFRKAKGKAIEIMAMVYDPFHDDKHVLAVASLAQKIYKSLPEKEKATADLEVILLASYYHDTSRKSIKTKILLQPILDEALSGKIAYDLLASLGYSDGEAQKVRNAIKGYGKNNDINSQVFSDADKVEFFSPSRMDRAIRRFEKGLFPRYLLNLYSVPCTFLIRRIPGTLYFQKSKEIQKAYYKNLKKYFAENSERLSKLLYRPVFNYLYSALGL